MSEAPERIWADMDGCWWDKPYGESPEYVRCDMLQEIFARYSRVEADRIEELEARLAKAQIFVQGFAFRALCREHKKAEQWLLSQDELAYTRDYEIVQARTLLAELKGEE